MLFQIVDYLKFIEISNPPNLLKSYNRKTLKIQDYLIKA